MKSTDINFLSYVEMRSILKKEVLLTEVAPALGLCFQMKERVDSTNVFLFKCCFCKSRSCSMKVFENTQEFLCCDVSASALINSQSCGINGDIFTLVCRLKNLLPAEAVAWLIRYVQPGGINYVVPVSVKPVPPKGLVKKEAPKIIVEKVVVKPHKNKNENKGKRMRTVLSSHKVPTS